MNKIGILGADGFLGKALCKQFPDAVRITKHNYIAFVHEEFDVFINANGNSKKYLAEQHPYMDFKASVDSVYRTFTDFKIKKYIYISSVDAYGDTMYGFHKHLAELIIRKNAERCLILRCSAMIGQGLKKGVVKDLIEGNPLWITSDSEMRFITVTEVGKIIESLIKENYTQKTFNVAGSGTIKVSEIAEMLGVGYKVRLGAKTENSWIGMFWDIEDIFPIKTSKQYIQEFIYERESNNMVNI